MQHPAIRIVAVAAFVLLFSRGSASLAATDSVHSHFDAKTVAFTITAHVEGHDRPVGKAYINGDVERMDTEQDGTTQSTIMDAAKNVMLTLDPQTKQATLIRRVNVPTGDVPPGMMQQLDQHVCACRPGEQVTLSASDLAISKLMACKLTGYRIASETENMEVWGDPVTMRPYLADPSH